MSSEPTTPQQTPDAPEAPKQRASVHERRLNRQQTKPNKSQVKAAQARAAQTAIAPAVSDPASSEISVQAPGAEAPVKLTSAQRRALERGGATRGTGMPVGTFNLSREDEMAMIREDLHRLLIIAGALLIGMLVLLFFID